MLRSNVRVGPRIGPRVFSLRDRIDHLKHIYELYAFDVPSLPNLRQFDSLGYYCSRGLLRKLSKTCLTSLAIGFDSRDPMNLCHFPDLQILRLCALRAGLWVGHLGLPGSTHHALTTLAIYGNTGTYKKHKFESLGSVSLPNLRVLSLQGYAVHVRGLYHFIEQHRTLLEVNISLYARSQLCLSSLRKLMDGTGVWECTADISCSLDSPGVRTLTREYQAFAFARRPIPISIPGSKMPGPQVYEITEFAWHPSSKVGDDARFPHFLAALRLDDYGASLTNITYASSCPHDGAAFSTVIVRLFAYMLDQSLTRLLQTMIKQGLRTCANLQALTISIDFDPFAPTPPFADLRDAPLRYDQASLQIKDLAVFDVQELYGIKPMMWIAW